MEDNRRFPGADIFDNENANGNDSFPLSFEVLHLMNDSTNLPHHEMLYLKSLEHSEVKRLECIELDDESVKEAVYLIHLIAYNVLGSLLVILGILTNGLCIIVTSRKKLHRMHITRYIRLLAGTDLIGYLAFIPSIIEPSFCVFESYTLAFYNAHFGLMFVSFARSLSFFLIIWISYDRCLAVWAPGRFKKVKNSKVLQYRVIGTFIFSLIGYGPLMAMGVVKSETICGSNSDKSYWKFETGFTRTEINSWYRSYRILSGFLFYWIPGTILFGLSIALVVGLIKKHYQVEISKASSKFRKNLFLTITVLAINSFTVFCSMPLTIIAVFFDVKEIGKCHRGLSTEIGFSIGVLLHMLWHVINVMFVFFLNPDYKRELIVTLSLMPVIGPILRKYTPINIERYSYCNDDYTEESMRNSTRGKSTIIENNVIHNPASSITIDSHSVVS